jgi:hypothetical protein
MNKNIYKQNILLHGTVFSRIMQTQLSRDNCADSRHSPMLAGPKINVVKTAEII